MANNKSNFDNVTRRAKRTIKVSFTIADGTYQNQEVLVGVLEFEITFLRYKSEYLI